MLTEQELTPAEKRKALVAYAKKQAELEDWKAYERQRADYMLELVATWQYGHGTRAQYRYGCRCTKCKQANAEYQREYRKNGAPPKPERRHGVRKYLTEGCRCEDCKEIYRGFLRERRERLNDKRRPDFPHGTNAGYGRKCRCNACRQAHADYKPKVGRKASKFAGMTSAKYYQAHPEEIPEHVPHNQNRYIWYGCRCAECKGANRLYVETMRKRRRARLNAEKQNLCEAEIQG